MDKLCHRCRALDSSHQSSRTNNTIYNKILLNQKDDHGECVKILLEAGADVNAAKSDGSAIVQAARRGHVKRLQALITAGADVNKHYDVVFRQSNTIKRDQIKCQNALTNAVSKGNIECVELLIKAGATVNKVGHQEMSVLWLAVQQDNVTCAGLLVKAGADVNGDRIRTPLFYAVTIKATQCVDLLLRSGADVNATHTRGTTALMLVNDGECCRLLLKYHTQINRRDRWGDNALKKYMTECEAINKDICSLLFAAGETAPRTVTRWFPQHELIKVIDYLPQIWIQFYLKQLCREAIRKHLLELDPYTNLFDRIPRLGLPSSLIEYLLYYMSLDSSSPPHDDTK